MIVDTPGGPLMSGCVLRWAGALAVVAWVAAVPLQAGQDEKPEAGKLVQMQFEKDKVKYDYLLYLPQEYGKNDKTPLVLFHHGKGDKLVRLKKSGLPRQIERKKDAP